MPDIIELTQRFGAISIAIDAVCDYCGAPLEVYAGFIPGEEDAICAGCGLPISG